MSTITIQQLADKLGLSGAAVSMALRGKCGVSEETRERVLEAARQYGYTPPQKAPRRKTVRKQGDSGFCPVLIVFREKEWSDEAATFFASMLEKLERMAGGLLVYYIDPPEEGHPIDLEKIRRINETASVALIHGVSLETEQLELLLERLRCPAVVFDRAPEGIAVHSVSMDNSGIISGAVREFVRLGYRKFTFIRTGELWHIPNRSRLAGYHLAQQELLARFPDLGLDFTETDLPDRYADEKAREAFVQAADGRVCFSAQDYTALYASFLLGEDAGRTILGGFDDFPCIQQIRTTTFTFRYELDSVCQTAMGLAESISQKPYLPSMHIGVTGQMICRNFDPAADFSDWKGENKNRSRIGRLRLTGNL